MPRLAPSFLLLLSAAFAVSAQQDECSTQVHVSSEADLSPVMACSAFSGSVIISGSNINSVAWPALKSLAGSIKISSNSHLTTLSLNGLQASTGTITLFNNTLLSVISMSNLESLGGLEIITAPDLKQLSLPKIQALSSLKIEDTGLDNSGTLPWTSLSKVTDFGVSNNKFLKSIEMPSLTSISGRLVVAANGLMEGRGKGLSLLLPNLTSVSNCTLRHLTGLQILSLSEVSSSLSFDETNLEAIKAPQLKTIGQTLSIVSNNLLSNISFPDLTSIGGALLIANNTDLTDISGFGKLKDISGVLNMRGAFNNISLPSVSTVKGGMSILSSSKDFDCSSINHVKSAARGKTVCQAMVKSAKPTNANGTDLAGSLVESSATTVISDPEIIWAAVAVLSSVAYIF